MILSVVTVHLDDFAGLSATRASLRRHLSDPAVHWIVIDGDSSPGRAEDSESLRGAREAADEYVSEPDAGIYDAMNKGTRLARGDYVLYLNAGDELHERFSLEGLAAELGDDRPGMIWGTCHERYPDGRRVRVKNRSPWLAWYGIPVNHQNVLFRRDLLGDAPYRLEYRYNADYDLIGRLLKQGTAVRRTEMPVAVFARGGASARNFSEMLKEEEALRTLHFGVSPALSRGITAFKRLTGRLGRVPAIRRVLRKWV
ncbi:MAG: glycosyltransferase [Xanthomonadales bacterium]|nr:glycosyltransferase [Xanthomonadales bacterium]